MTRSTLAALGVALAFLLLAASVIDDYGLTWDIANGEVPHGERYLSYLETGDDRYLDLGPAGRRPELRAPHPDGDVTPIMPFHQSYPLSAILSALSCRVLWGSWGAIGAIPAHLWIAPLFVALLLFVLVRSGAREASWVAGGMAAVFLVFSPRFFAHAMNNLKDTPETALYFVVMLLIYRSLERGGAMSLAWAGFVGGLALAQKPNALFLPIHGGLLAVTWMALARLRWAMRPTLSWRGVLLAAALFPLAWILASPGMWADPLGVAIERLAFLKGVSTQAGLWEPLESARAVAKTTPPVILILAGIGCLFAKVSGSWRVFLLLGVFVPLARTSLPGFRNFDGVRHYLEFWPFLASLAGLGAWVVATAATRFLADRPSPRRLLVGGVCLLLAAHPIVTTARVHPNGVCYFNAFAGGLSGARAKDPSEASDYWANSYHQGFRILAGMSPTSGSQLIVPVAEHVAASEAPVMLPSGVQMADPYEPPTGSCYVMFITRESWYGAYADLIEWLLQGGYERRAIEVDGAPILFLFTLDDPKDATHAHRLWSEPRAYYRLLMELARRGPTDGGIGAPAVALYLRQIKARGEEATVRELTSLVPDDLHAEIAPAVRFAQRIAP